MMSSALRRSLRIPFRLIFTFALALDLAAAASATAFRIELDSAGCDPVTNVCAKTDNSSLPLGQYATRTGYSVVASADVTASTIKFFVDSAQSGFLYVSFFDTYTLTGPAALMGTQTTITPTLHVTGTMSEGAFASGFLGIGGVTAKLGNFIPDPPPGQTFLEQFRVSPFDPTTAQKQVTLPGAFSASEITVPIDFTLFAPITVTYGIPFDVGYSIYTGGATHTIFDISHTGTVSFDGLAADASLSSQLGYTQGSVPTGTVPEPSSVLLLSIGLLVSAVITRRRRFARVATIAFLALTTCALCFAQADWTQRFPSTSPPARSSMAMAQFGGDTVMFGGSTSSSTSTFFNDTWIWDGTNWNQITSFGLFGTGTHPPARRAAAMAYDSDTGEAVLFGGENSSSFLGDTWILRLNTTSTKLGTRTYYSWTQITASPSPLPREGARMAYDPSSGRLILSGGFGIDSTGHTTLFDDTWAYNSGTWTQINQTGPPARERSSMAICAPNVNSPPRSILLFGGISGITSLNDTWAFFTPTFLSIPDWAQVSEATSPAARFDHAMAFYPVSKQTLMYGGGTSGGVFGDTWNAFCGSWAQAAPAHTPGAREFHGMATAQGGFTVVMFGGRKVTSTSFTDNAETWTWGRRAACLPTDGSEVRVGSKISCLFDQIDGVNFGGWTASGFGPPFRDELKPTFRTNSPGPAAITAEWTDTTGYHTQTYHYTIVRPNQ